MCTIHYIDRITGKEEVEKVYGQSFLEIMYGKSFLNKLLTPIFPLIVKFPALSSYYGYLQKRPASRKKIEPFIREFHVDPREFLEPVSHYNSFNDFFIRKLKPEARPLAQGNQVAIIPADGRYYFYQRIDQSDGFIVKGKKLNLATLLQDEKLAAKYHQGSMVAARLCPSDYHRFHFPCEGIPNETHYINGWYSSVNPIAIRNNIEIFTENKRTLTEIETTHFGKVLYIDVGATCVGSIHQTFTPHTLQAKGAEKGYFEFGASSLILLFEKDVIKFEEDLVAATKRGLEIRCLMGQSMGTSR